MSVVRHKRFVIFYSIFYIILQHISSFLKPSSGNLTFFKKDYHTQQREMFVFVYTCMWSQLHSARCNSRNQAKAQE